MINSNNKVNIIISIYAAKLNLSLKTTNIGIKKINGLVLKIYGITIARFSMIDKFGQISFFKETFLLVDTNMEVILGMFFFLLSYVNVNFEIVTGEFT